VDYQHYLLRITELELLDRERRATERRIRQAKFPVVKTMESFDFLAIPSLNKTLVLELARCEFLARREKWHGENAHRPGSGPGFMSTRAPCALHYHCRSGPHIGSEE
jgi:hypothetical protein